MGLFPMFEKLAGFTSILFDIFLGLEMAGKADGISHVLQGKILAVDYMNYESACA